MGRFPGRHRPLNANVGCPQRKRERDQAVQKHDCRLKESRGTISKGTTEKDRSISSWNAGHRAMGVTAEEVSKCQHRVRGRERTPIIMAKRSRLPRQGCLPKCECSMRQLVGFAPSTGERGERYPEANSPTETKKRVPCGTRNAAGYLDGSRCI